MAEILTLKIGGDPVNVNRELTWIWVDVETLQLALPTHHRTLPTMFHSDSIANKTD